jgi:hypothetical protein
MATVPTIEVVKFSVKDVYKEDQTVLNDALALVKSAPGCRRYVFIRR